VLGAAEARTHRAKLHKKGAVAFKNGLVEEAAGMVEEMEESS
jgi:hypothetical protein